MRSACTVSRPSLPTCPVVPKSSKVEVAERLEANKVKAADPNWQKGCAISYDVAHRNKNSEKKGWRGDIHDYGIYLAKELLCLWKSHFPVAVFLPADGQNWINFTVFPASTAFAFSMKLLLAWSTNSNFLLFISPSAVSGKWAKSRLRVWLTRVNPSDPKSECIPLNQLWLYIDQLTEYMKWRPGGKSKLPIREIERWEYWRREYQFTVNKQNWLRCTNFITYLSTQWKMCCSKQLQSNSTTLREQGKQILFLYTLVVINGTDTRINSIFRVVVKVICFPVHVINICIKPSPQKNPNKQTTPLHK